jgi:uncharacterized protein YcfJ
MNKSILMTAICAGLALAPAAQAGHGYDNGGDFYDYAQVVRAEPIVNRIRVSEPREECWEERAPVRDSGYHSATPMILGGIIGGVVGSTMGKGRGRDAAIVAGTVLGGSVGRDVGRQSASGGTYRTSSQEVCRMVDDYREEERIEGYDVTYRYQGQEYFTRLPYDPGGRMRVRVDVTPAP